MTIQRLTKPVIAEVHGVATAAGCQLVAMCDLAVAAEGSRFAASSIWVFSFDAGRRAVAQRVAQARSGDVAHGRLYQC